MRSIRVPPNAVRQPVVPREAFWRQRTRWQVCVGGSGSVTLLVSLHATARPNAASADRPALIHEHLVDEGVSMPQGRHRSSSASFGPQPRPVRHVAASTKGADFTRRHLPTPHEPPSAVVSASMKGADFTRRPSPLQTGVRTRQKTSYARPLIAAVMSWLPAHPDDC